MLKKPSLIPTFYILSLYRHPEGSPFDFFSSLSQGTKSCFCPNPTPRSPPSKVSGRGADPLKFPEKPERTRRGRLKNPQISPRNPPGDPKGRQLVPRFGIPKQDPAEPGQEGSKPPDSNPYFLHPIISFSFLHFFWIGILIRTPGHLGPQNYPRDPEVNWFGSCPATISPLRTPDTPSEPGPPKKFLTHFFFFLPYTVVFPVTTLGPKTLRGPRILFQDQFTNPPQAPIDPILRICLAVLGTFFNSSILQFFTNYELKIIPKQKNPEMNPP